MTTENFFPISKSNFFQFPPTDSHSFTCKLNPSPHLDTFICKHDNFIKNSFRSELATRFGNENKLDSSSETSNCHSFSKPRGFRRINSAFTRCESSISACSDEIFMYPTMYQKLVSTSEKLGLKFHLLCKSCQDNIFSSKNNYSNNNLFNLKIDLVHNFCFRSHRKVTNINKFEISNVKKKRKMDRDCIHKKIKARLFKYIKETLKLFILEEFSNLKIQQKVISDVTLDFNKRLLCSKLSSVFVECNLYFNSVKQISEISKRGKEDELNMFLNKSVGECYRDYLNSDTFLKDLEKFKNDNYVETFKAYCLSFLDYYNQEANYRKLKSSYK